MPGALGFPNVAEMGGVSISETPETRGECIDRLQKLLRDDPSFKGTLDERVLVMFLRSRWSDVETTFRVVKNYFKARRDMPDYFRNLTPSNIPYKAVCTQHKLMMISKERDHLGRSVGLLRIGAWRPSMCSLTDLTRCLIVLTESHLTVEETQMGGFVSVFDVEGLSLYHMAHLTPRYFLRILHVLQDCLPLRTEKIYVVNNPPIFALLYAAAKPFLHKKLLSRIEVLGSDIHKLQAAVPADVISKRHGGTLEDFDYDGQEAFIQERSAYFVHMDGCGY